MSLGAPNALAAVGAAPRTGGLFPPQAGPMPHTGGPMQGQQGSPMAGLLGPGWSWGAQPMQFAGASVPQPFIDAGPRVTLPLFSWNGGDPVSSGWQPSGYSPYITPQSPVPRRSQPIPGQGGGEADRLNALVLAALANQPAQANNTADANIRRFMGIA